MPSMELRIDASSVYKCMVFSKIHLEARKALEGSQYFRPLHHMEISTSWKQV